MWLNQILIYYLFDHNLTYCDLMSLQHPCASSHTVSGAVEETQSQICFTVEGLRLVWRGGNFSWLFKLLNVSFSVLSEGTHTGTFARHWNGVLGFGYPKQSNIWSLALPRYKWRWRCTDWRFFFTVNSQLLCIFFTNPFLVILICDPSSFVLCVDRRNWFLTLSTI